MNAATAIQHLSPNQRAWGRFRRHRLGYWSLWIFLVVLLLSTAAELLSNDKFRSDAVVAIVCRAAANLFLEIDYPDTRDTFLAALLDRIGKRKDWRRVVRAIGRGLRLTFGLNVVRCAEAEEIVAAWLRHRESLRAT